MLNNNIKKTTKLIHDLLEVIPIALLHDAIIFGSAAITLNGIDIHREIDDLDIFVSKKSYSQLRLHPKLYEEQKNETLKYLSVKGKKNIELLAIIPDADFHMIMMNARSLDKSSQLLVASVSDLCKWKKIQGRKKDINDIHFMGC